VIVATEAPAKALDFADLARLEPGLAALERAIRAWRQRRGRRGATAAWYSRGGFKPRLVRLVGWCSDSVYPELRGCTAYATAYGHLYELLFGDAGVPDRVESARPEDDL
jgi:hypothetical protein